MGSKSRAINRAALPLCRAMESRWKKCLISTAGVFPHRRASLVAIFLRKSTATGSQPPNDSTTRGWKKTPCAWQCSKCARFLDAFLTSMAVAAVSAARCKNAFNVGDVTLTSKATFRPSVRWFVITFFFLEEKGGNINLNFHGKNEIVFSEIECKDTANNRSTLTVF